MDFDAYVRSLGLDPANLSPEQHQRLEAAWRASLRPAPAPAPVPAPAPGGPLPAPVPAPAPGARPPTAAELELERATAQAETENRRRADIVALAQRFMLQAPDRVREFQDYATLAIAGNI